MGGWGESEIIDLIIRDKASQEGSKWQVHCGPWPVLDVSSIWPISHPGLW